MSNHRIVNDVGYKKIYPMALSEDSGFCHYCGRTANHSLALHWDHVPPLNVKIPFDESLYSQIRKTLIRSCAECNLLAGDIPHMDYFERHLWLKVRYLGRYKSVLTDCLLDEYREDEEIQLTTTKPTLRELLTMLGFGLADIDLLDSPILEVCNKPTRRKIKNLISDFLYGAPQEDDLPDDEDSQGGELVSENDVDETAECIDFKELVDFIFSERQAEININSDDNFIEWIKVHPGRAEVLGYSIEAVKSANIEWSKVRNECRLLKADEEAKLQIKLERNSQKKEPEQKNIKFFGPTIDELINARKLKPDYRSKNKKVSNAANNFSIWEKEIELLKLIIQQRFFDDAVLSDDQFQYFTQQAGLSETKLEGFIRCLAKDHCRFLKFIPSKLTKRYGVG